LSAAQLAGWGAGITFTLNGTFTYFNSDGNLELALWSASLSAGATVIGGWVGDVAPVEAWMLGIDASIATDAAEVLICPE